MYKQYDIAVIGGDLRQIYMANEFIYKGYSVIVYGLSHQTLSAQAKSAKTLEEALSSSHTIICPVPFTRNQFNITNEDGFPDLTVENLLNNLRESSKLFGGNIPSSVSKYCSTHSITVYDLMEMNDVAILNAVATAEGSIAEAIKRSTINLHQSNCLVLGFGRCAQVLAKKLYALDAAVCIGARSKDARAFAEAFGYTSISLDYLDDQLINFNFIFNTIPSVILTKSRLEKVLPQVTIIDIASAPGGIDYNAAESAKINATLCPGLPGRYAPKTSGEILVSAIENILIESSDENEVSRP